MHNYNISVVLQLDTLKERIYVLDQGVDIRLVYVLI
jgi:hypothetical protein